MKPDYKKMAKGAKEFLKQFPNGKIQKFKNTGRMKDFKLEEATLLANLFLDADKYLNLLDKYKGANNPKHEKLARQFFEAVLASKPFNNPHSLKNIPNLPHSKYLDGEGFWTGEDYQLLSFLCKTNFTSQEIKKILEAEGFQYSLRTIQQSRCKPKRKFSEIVPV